ncbi:hypothetical protein JZ751_013743 [Albula glossodonta]|uniref:Uncharacterized protein n=1 Tax=Albula glossodonta TaxID=121402 RepID=A0A8T2NRN1_9TELE|nr:hypothetical protein JZ751_013743 [Albula glossodonta]
MGQNRPVTCSGQPEQRGLYDLKLQKQHRLLVNWPGWDSALGQCRCKNRKANVPSDKMQKLGKSPPSIGSPAGMKFLEKSEASISVAEDVSEEVTNDRLKAGAKEEADSLNWPKNGHMGGATAEKRARLETEEPGSPRAHTTEDAFNIFGKSKVAKLRIQQVSLDIQMDVVAQASSSSQKHSQQK